MEKVLAQQRFADKAWKFLNQEIPVDFSGLIKLPNFGHEPLTPEIENLIKNKLDQLQLETKSELGILELTEQFCLQIQTEYKGMINFENIEGGTLGLKKFIQEYIEIEIEANKSQELQKLMVRFLGITNYEKGGMENAFSVETRLIRLVMERADCSMVQAYFIYRSALVKYKKKLKENNSESAENYLLESFKMYVEFSKISQNNISIATGLYVIRNCIEGIAPILLGKTYGIVGVAGYILCNNLIKNIPGVFADVQLIKGNNNILNNKFEILLKKLIAENDALEGGSDELSVKMQILMDGLNSIKSINQRYSSDLIPKLIQIVVIISILSSLQPVLIGTAVAAMPVTFIMSQLLKYKLKDFVNLKHATQEDFMGSLTQTLKLKKDIHGVSSNTEQAQSYLREKFNNNLEANANLDKFMSMYNGVLSQLQYVISGLGATGVSIVNPDLGLEDSGTLFGSIVSIHTLLHLVSVVADAGNANAQDVLNIKRLENELQINLKQIKEEVDTDNVVNSQELKSEVLNVVYQPQNAPLVRFSIEPGVDIGEKVFAFDKGVPDEIDNQSKAYPGEIKLITGASGFGKSTLLEAMAGLKKLPGTSITAGETIISSDNPDQVAQWRDICKYVPQKPQWRQGWNLFENIRLQRSNIDDNRLHLVLDMLGLDQDFISKYNNTQQKPSGGEMIRIGFARAIAQDPLPKYILLDEPTAGLDPGAGKWVYDKIKFLSESHGVSFVIVTHDQEMIADFDDLFGNQLENPDDKSNPRYSQLKFEKKL
jgi:ABC-type lipoprotein export system ATPase subunit